MSVLTTKEIMEIIPHRQPFLLIDTIEELEPGKRAVGKKCVSYNEPYFAGHFPAEPVNARCADRGSTGTGWCRSKSLDVMNSKEKPLILEPSILQSSNVKLFRETF